MISNKGRIINTIFNNYTIKAKKKIKIKNVRKNKGGYCMVTLYKDGKSKVCMIHRLVAEMFIPNPLNKKEVNHIDGNKSNNCVSNLEWVTHSENMEHSYKNNLNKNHKKFKQYDLNGNFIREWYSMREIAKHFGLTIGKLSYDLKKYNYNYINYIWVLED